MGQLFSDGNRVKSTRENAITEPVSARTRRVNGRTESVNAFTDRVSARTDPVNARTRLVRARTTLRRVRTRSAKARTESVTAFPVSVNAGTRSVRAFTGAGAAAVGREGGDAARRLSKAGRSCCSARMASASTSTKASPFLLLFRNAGADTHAHLSETERVELARKWNAWYDGLAAQGKVEHGRPLELGGRVVSGAGGERVTDGPFAEAKEVVGGYFFLKVADLDEATEIAKQCPGLPLGLSVEVRPVAEVSPVLQGVAGRPPQE